MIVGQLVLKVFVAAVSIDTVPEVANQAEVGVVVGVSSPFAPPAAVMEGAPAPLS